VLRMDIELDYFDEHSPQGYAQKSATLRMAWLHA
jgi:hypothetical protein